MLSFDIEDWFQVENLKGGVKKAEWDNKELRIVENTFKLLSILDKHNTKATFFTLAWVAERVPELILEIYKQRHEIASHGYGHELIYDLTEEEVRKDIKKSKKILESIIDDEVIGYRAPNFSITERAIDILREEGFKYDSSVFPTIAHDRYGRINYTNLNTNRMVWKLPSAFYEVSISTLDVWKVKIPWAGGGYFRSIPYSIYKVGINRIINKYGSFLFYFHPWEIDHLQPRIKNIKLNYRIRHYIGLKRAEAKLNRLVKDFPFGTIKSGLKMLGFPIR